MTFSPKPARMQAAFETMPIHWQHLIGNPIGNIHDQTVAIDMTRHGDMEGPISLFGIRA